MSDTSRTCGNCKYERDGTCHRFPPVVTYAPTYAGDFVPVSPTVDGEDWCGEFAIRPYAGEPMFPKFAEVTKRGAGQQSFMEVSE